MFVNSTVPINLLEVKQCIKTCITIRFQNKRGHNCDVLIVSLDMLNNYTVVDKKKFYSFKI